MAKQTTKKKAVLPEKEVAAIAAVTAFDKRHEGKTLSEEQKKERKSLVDAVKALKFVRIANKRLPRTLAAIENIAKLGTSGYVRSEAQVKAIVDALEKKVARVKSALSGAKAGKEEFTLPE